MERRHYDGEVVLQLLSPDETAKFHLMTEFLSASLKVFSFILLYILISIQTITFTDVYLFPGQYRCTRCVPSPVPWPWTEGTGGLAGVSGLCGEEGLLHPQGRNPFTAQCNQSIEYVLMKM